MLSVAKLADALQSLFTTDADHPATLTDFVKRKRLWTGLAFALALVLGWLERPDASLERLASHAGSRLAARKAKEMAKVANL